MVLMISCNHFSLFYNFSIRQNCSLIFSVALHTIEISLLGYYKRSSLDRFKIKLRTKWVKFYLSGF